MKISGSKTGNIKGTDQKSLITQHILFWLVIYMVFVLIDQNQFSLKLSLIKELINVFFYAFVVYLNLWILIPYYLSSKRLVLYSLLLVLLAVLITPIKTFVLFQLVSQYQLSLYILGSQLISPYTYQELLTVNHVQQLR